MAGPTDSDYGICDAFTDPYCDLCFEIKGLNIGVSGFCRECVQFLCTDCHAVHRKVQACRHHDVVQGDDMPKSQADKPPRFDFCDVHPNQLKDEFCCDHRSLICTICASTGHKECCIKPVKDACTILDVSETSALYDKIKGLKEALKSSLTSVGNELKKMKDQEKAMLQDVQQVYDQITAKVNKLFDSIKGEIQTSCQSQIDLLSRHQKKVNGMISKLDSLISDVGEMKAKPIDTKVFLILQETVNYTTKCTMEFQESRRSLQFASLTFVPGKPIGDILSSSFTFGTIRRLESKLPDVDMFIPEILFPVFALTQTAARSKSGLSGTTAKPPVSRPPQPLSKMKATRQGTYNVRHADDIKSGYITGIAITKDKRILVVDFDNRNVKMFSQDMTFLSTVSAPVNLIDIAVISEREAVVTTSAKSLIILDISGLQLSIKTTTQLSKLVHGISRYYNKLVVASPDNPKSVKQIDKTGRVYWSTSSDQQGQRLFGFPQFLTSPGDGRSSNVIVTDIYFNTLTLLNGDTGEVITRRQLKVGRFPRGVTTDPAGNVYVCYNMESAVTVLPEDLSEEKILLSEENGLLAGPQAIVHADETHQLIISYGSHYIDCFQLS